MNDGEMLEVSRLGRNGDGVAGTIAAPVYIADALAGERFRRLPSGFERVGPPSPERVRPPCRHFGACGGCVAQHMSTALYTEWKQELLLTAFRVQRLEVDLAPLIVVPPGARRRASFTASAAGGRVTLGFHVRRSHTLVDLAECPVLAPQVVGALPALRDIAAALATGVGRRAATAAFHIEVAALPAGLDVAVRGLASVPAMALAARLAAIARGAGWARLTVEGQIVAAIRTPELVTAAGAIALPPGAFFQAAAEAEAAMTRAVVGGVGQARRVADLFCGAGTFTLPLARGARVLAVDADTPALAALTSAVRATAGLKPVTTLRRDLISEPLAPQELADIDAVVLDPPRDGAARQAEAIARSKLARVVAVSCNPATLARDCRILVDAGFRLGRVSGIDQFLWSEHLEAVVVLERGR